MDNHYIPKFYFGPWLDDGVHLTQFSRTPTGAISKKRKTPTQICYQPDLHTFSGDHHADRKDDVELWLKNSIDDKAAPAIVKLLAGGLPALSDGDAAAIAGFILSLVVRRPENVALLQGQAPGVWKAAMDQRESAVRAELAQIEGGSVFSSLSDYAEMALPGVVENAGNYLITDITADGRYWKRLMELCWWVADFSGTQIDSQPTSDRAVDFSCASLDDPNMSAVLPLSPHKVLFLTNQNTRDRMQEQGLASIGLITIRRTIAGARQFVYGTSATNVNLIEKYLPSL